MDELNLFKWDNTRKAISQLQLLLHCSICDKVAVDPQCLGRCDHFFCLACVEKVENGVCPKCTVPAPPCERNPDRIINDLAAASKDLLDILNGGQISVEQGLESPNYVPCTPKRQIRSSVPLQDLIVTKLSEKSTSGVCRQSTPPSVKTESNKHMEKICKKLRTTPKAANAKNKTVNKKSKMVTPLKTPKSIEKASKIVLATPESTKFPKATLLATQVSSPGTTPVNKRNTKGETLLHVACLKGEKEKVIQLLSEGANPNTKDNAGWTPLHDACSHGFQDIVELLLRHGALVDVPGGNNGTPLHDAVTQGQLDLIKLLKAWGASDSARNLYGQTARSLAAQCQSPSEINAALDTPKDPSLKHLPLILPTAERIFLLGFGLSPDQSRKLEHFSRMLRARLVSEFSDEVTHLIVSCSEDRVALNTGLTYLMGVVSGKRILSHTWVEECLSEGKLVDVKQHQARGAASGNAELAPVNARVNAEQLLPKLFTGCYMFLWGNFRDPGLSKKEVEALIRAGGGMIMGREPNPESISEAERTVPYHTTLDSPFASCSHYIIYSDFDAQPLIKYNMAHVKSKSLSWLLACAEHWQLLPNHPM